MARDALTGGGRRLCDAARISFSILSKLSSLELAMAAGAALFSRDVSGFTIFDFSVGTPAELSFVC